MFSCCAFTLTLVAYLIIVPVATTQQCHANPLIINPTAQARFAVVASIRQSTKTEECYKVSQNAVQYLAAIEWAVNAINSADLLKVLNLGFDVYDDCGLDRFSTFGAMDAVSTSFPAKVTSCTGNKTTFNLGILGTTRSQTSYTVASLLNGTNIPLLSPFASLPELRNFDNFLRTTPDDKQQVNAIVQLLIELEWTYVAAIHTDDNYGFNGVMEIKVLAKQHNICVDVVESFSSTEDFSSDTTRQNLYEKLEQQQQRSQDRQLGVIYFGNRNVIKSLLSRLRLYPKFKEVIWLMTDFVGRSEDVFSAVENVSRGFITISSASVSINGAREHYLDKWRNKDSMSIDPIERLLSEVANEAQESYRSDYVRPVVDAVFAMATAFNDIFQEKCRGYTAVCDGFWEYLQKNYLRKLKTVKFSYSSLNSTQEPKELIQLGKKIEFNEKGDYVASNATPLYDVNIYRNGKFEKVGEYVGQTLQVNNSQLQTYKNSSCARICENCQTKPDIPYRYHYGGDHSQALILGIFPLHTINETTRYGCGELDTFSLFVIVVEAFFFAVKEISQRENMNFSALAFDDCYSENRASLIISEFFSGKLKIPDSRGNFLDPNNVVTVIGAAASGVTVPMTFQFTALKIPVISYASSSPDLDDRVNYPYFLRTVPSDVDQAKAMIEIVKYLKWDYIGGILYVNNNYGSKGKELLMRYANESDICVGKAIEIQEAEDGSLQVINEMRKTNSNVFMYFGTDVRLKALLQKMKNDKFKSVVFLASEDWGERQDILDENGDMVMGSITSKFETKSAVKGFDSHLQSLEPKEENTNDWFRTFWANFFGCNPPGRFDKTKEKDCFTERFSATNISQFIDNQRVVHVMNAVFAVGTAMVNVKKDLCGGLFPCPNLKSHVGDVSQAIQNAKLSVDGSLFSVFNEKGNGNVGFQILNIQKTVTQTYDYVPVGEYTNGQLDLKLANVRFYNNENSQCSKENCSHCRFSQSTTLASTTTGPSVTGSDEFRMAEIILIALLGSLLVFFIFSLVIITRYFQRKMKDLRIRVLENRPRVMYVNESAVVSNPLPTGNGITFQNPNHSNGSMSVTNDGTSGLRGFDNQAFIRESYNHLNDGSDNSARVQRMDYSPLEQDHPGIVEKRSRKISESLDFRPELPPRDHPTSRKYNSSSSLDSGGTVTPTVPKMGITRSMQAQANGQVPFDSGTPSPTGPKTGRLLPTIDPVTDAPVSPLASPTHSSSSSSQKLMPSPRGIMRTLPVSDRGMHSPTFAMNGHHKNLAHLSQNLNSSAGSVSPEDISAEFPPPPDFTQPIPTSVPQTAKIKSRISSSRLADDAARISKV